MQKLRRAEQLTQSDLDELERMFLEEGVSDENRLAKLREEGGLGRFLRSLAGLDRQASKEAFSNLASKSLTANQTEFLNLILDHLSESGTIDPRRFYESPFTDIDDLGINGVFEPAEVKSIVSTLKILDQAAAA
ncbi:MAG: type I restriction-modification enzyme R subunit C-terminal domain-containing protein [Paracoccaceae bacterium]|nr:type I restriction-modification enzyme R subunit C-terminal domain-containing protein [Paracoccaceae bacterium]MDG2259653.1 type I restriction-modification enzyme R subunit C-terminal domain-containing protein [Paracoccaceae bacterium]